MMSTVVGVVGKSNGLRKPKAKDADEKARRRTLDIVKFRIETGDNPNRSAIFLVAIIGVTRY